MTNDAPTLSAPTGRRCWRLSECPAGSHLPSLDSLYEFTGQADGFRLFRSHDRCGEEPMICVRRHAGDDLSFGRIQIAFGQRLVFVFEQTLDVGFTDIEPSLTFFCMFSVALIANVCAPQSESVVARQAPDLALRHVPGVSDTRAP